MKKKPVKKQTSTSQKESHTTQQVDTAQTNPITTPNVSNIEEVVLSNKLLYFKLEY